MLFRLGQAASEIQSAQQLWIEVNGPESTARPVDTRKVNCLGSLIRMDRRSVPLTTGELAIDDLGATRVRRRWPA